MDQQTLRDRIQSLNQQLERANRMSSQLSQEALVLTGCIQENTRHLNDLIKTDKEKAEKEGKLKEAEEGGQLNQQNDAA